jgi:hypothetical protein
MTPLRSRIREQLRDRAEEIHSIPLPPPIPRAEATNEQVNEAVQQTVRQIEATPAPRQTDYLKLRVDKRVAEVRVLEMLKFTFFELEGRLRRHLEMEATGNGMLTQEGTAAISEMRKIAEAVSKIELGESLLSVEDLHRGINPMERRNRKTKPTIG